MKRRESITLLGGAAASVSMPLSLCAQEAGRIYRIGFVSAAPREEPMYVAFFEELRGLGFVEGQNLSVIPGFGIRNELLGEAAAALVRAAPDAIIAAGPIAARAAQAATKTIPILAASDDMVEDGLVTSMRRPGGNTTGVSLLAPELDGKRQDLIMEAVPGIRRIAALSDPHVSTPQHLQDLKEAARARRGASGLFCNHPGRDRTGDERGECGERSGSQRPGNAAVLLQSANRAGARYGIAITCDLPMAGDGGARWPRRLRPAHHAMVPSIGTAAHPGAARDQSRRASRRAADKV